MLNERSRGAFLQPVEGGHVPFTPDARKLEIDQSTYFMYYELALANAPRSRRAGACADR